MTDFIPIDFEPRVGFKPRIKKNARILNSIEH